MTARPNVDAIEARSKIQILCDDELEDAREDARALCAYVRELEASLNSEARIAAAYAAKVEKERDHAVAERDAARDEAALLTRRLVVRQGELNGVSVQLDRARAKLAEVTAQATVLRDAVGWARSVLGDSSPYYSTVRALDAALAPDAGRALLAEVEALRAAAVPESAIYWKARYEAETKVSRELERDAKHERSRASLFAKAASDNLACLEVAREALEAVNMRISAIHGKPYMLSDHLESVALQKVIEALAKLDALKGGSR